MNGCHLWHNFEVGSSPLVYASVFSSSTMLERGGRLLIGGLVLKFNNSLRQRNGEMVLALVSPKAKQMNHNAAGGTYPSTL